MRYLIIIALFISIVSISACGNNNQKTESATTPDQPTISSKETTPVNTSDVIKVYVDAAGQITADGKPASLAELDSSFKKLKDLNGTVFYSRDTEKEAPDEAMKVVELVVKYSLPLQFYTDKTFTTIATPTGK